MHLHCKTSLVCAGVVVMLLLSLPIVVCTKVTMPEIQCRAPDSLVFAAPAAAIRAAPVDSIARWINLSGQPSSVDSLQISVPLHAYHICNSSVKACSTTCKTASLVQETDFWYVLIKNPNGQHAYVGIDKMDGFYRIVMAAEWQNKGVFDEIYHFCISTFNATPVIIESHEPDLLFFSIPSISDTNLTWYSPSLSFDTLGLKSTKEALEYLRAE